MIVWVVQPAIEKRILLRKLLTEPSGFVLSDTLESASKLLRALKRRRPEILLLDSQLPDMDGCECAFLIKQNYPEIEILLILQHEEEDVVLKALRCGVSGFIPKNMLHTHLLSSLEDLSAGGAPMTKSIVRQIVENFHPNPNSPLTRRERQILQAVAEGKTLRKISEELFIARETAKTHIRNIYSKLEVNCRAQAIAKANSARYI